MFDKSNIAISYSEQAFYANYYTLPEELLSWGFGYGFDPLIDRISVSQSGCLAFVRHIHAPDNPLDPVWESGDLCFINHNGLLKIVDIAETCCWFDNDTILYSKPYDSRLYSYNVGQDHYSVVLDKNSNELRIKSKTNMMLSFDKQYLVLFYSGAEGKDGSSVIDMYSLNDGTKFTVNLPMIADKVVIIPR